MRELSSRHLQIGRRGGAAGQREMMPRGKRMDACSRLHRMISDLTGILSVSRRYPVILAGDLNVTTQFPRSTPTQSERDAAAAAAAVFARLDGWGLTNCLSRQTTARTGSPNCNCRDGAACTHVKTFRAKNREGAG